MDETTNVCSAPVAAACGKGDLSKEEIAKQEAMSNIIKFVSGNSPYGDCFGVPGQLKNDMALVDSQEVLMFLCYLLYDVTQDNQQRNKQLYQLSCHSHSKDGTVVVPLGRI